MPAIAEIQKHALVSFIYRATGQTIRLVKVTSGIPWFLAKDICEVLEITRTDSALRNLAEKHRGTHTVSTPGGVQSMSIVNESGLYKLILRSRKRVAEPFGDWVTEEVLPSIRRTGGYSQTGLPPVTESQTIAMAVSTGLAQQPAAIAALLEPRFAALDALVHDVAPRLLAALEALASAPPPGLVQQLLPPAWATDDEIGDIRAIAKQYCNLAQKDCTLQSLWIESQETLGLSPSRVAFGKIPRRAVQPIIDVLLGRIAEARQVSLPESEAAPLIAKNRAANPKSDYNTVQVSEMLLASLGIRLEPEILSGALGLYEQLLSPEKPLYMRSARKQLAPEPYLDQARYDYIENCIRLHPTRISAPRLLLLSQSIEAREHMKEEEQPVKGRRGWHLYGKR